MPKSQNNNITKYYNQLLEKIKNDPVFEKTVAEKIKSISQEEAIPILEKYLAQTKILELNESLNKFKTLQKVFQNFEEITKEHFIIAYQEIYNLRNKMVLNKDIISTRWYGYNKDKFYIYDINEEKMLKGTSLGWDKEKKELALKLGKGLSSAQAAQNKAVEFDSLLGKALKKYVTDVDVNKNDYYTFYRIRPKGRKTTHIWLRNYVKSLGGDEHLWTTNSKGERVGKTYNQGNLFEAFDDATYTIIKDKWHKKDGENLVEIFEKEFQNLDSIMVQGEFFKQFFTKSIKLDNVKGTKQGDVNNKQIKSNKASIISAGTIKNRIDEIIIGLNHLIEQLQAGKYKLDRKQFKKDFDNLLPNKEITETVYQKIKENFIF